MSYIIIVGHGSRVESANMEVADLAQKLNQTGTFSQIRLAFMEFGAPSIQDALEQAIKDGARDVAIFPYFLVGGAHIRKDIPEILEEFSRNNQGMNIRMMDYFGKNKTIMAEAITRCLL